MRSPKLVLLLIPGTIFLLLLAIFIAKLPKSPPNKTDMPEVIPTATATPTQAPIDQTPIQALVQSVTDLQINDPQLTAPNFDRKISLPVEK